MKAHNWKNIIDNIDEDIVNSAAERFAGHYSHDDPSEYPADRHPTEYYVPKPAKKSRKGWWIGAGATAAAAVGVVVVLNNASLSTYNITPTQSSKVSSSASEIRAVDYSEGNSGVDIVPDIIKNDMDLSLFEEYFVGCWDGDVGAFDLSYGFSAEFDTDDYICVSIKEGIGGYELLALDAVGSYDLWYVSGDDTDTLMIYRDVFMDGDDYGSPTEDLSCMSTERYTKGGTPSDTALLGYFGMEKLARQMGVSSELLYNVAYSDEESGVSFDAADEYVLWYSDTDYIAVTAFWGMTDADLTCCCDLYWEKNDDGEWQYTVNPKDCSVMFTQSEFPDTLDETQFDIFEEYFTAMWLCDSDGETYEMSYYKDFFNANVDLRLVEDENGWWLYEIFKNDQRVVTAWFISADNTDVMLCYTVDPCGFVISAEYDAIYSRVNEASTPVTRYSVMGLCKFAYDNTEAFDSFIEDDIWSQKIDDEWSASYNDGYDSFDGYRIVTFDDGSYDIYWQVYNEAGEYKWVAENVTLESDGYTMGYAEFVDDSEISAVEGAMPSAALTDSFSTAEE